MKIGYLCGTLQPHAYSLMLLRELIDKNDSAVVHIFDDYGYYIDSKQIDVRGPCRWFNYPFVIAKAARRENIDIYHIQMEITNFGNPVGVFLAPLLMLFLRLSGIPVITTIHGPVFDSNHVKEQVSTLAPSPALKPIMYPALLILFRTTVFLSNETIVHGQVFRERLAEAYGVDLENNEISVVHHGVIEQ